MSQVVTPPEKFLRTVRADLRSANLYNANLCGADVSRADLSQANLTGAIFGEYVGAYQGLGIYMELAAHSFAIVLVFAAILVTAVLSLLLFGLVALIERIALPWYHNAILRNP